MKINKDMISQYFKPTKKYKNHIFNIHRKKITFNKYIEKITKHAIFLYIIKKYYFLNH